MIELAEQSNAPPEGIVLGGAKWLSSSALNMRIFCKRSRRNILLEERPAPKSVISSCKPTLFTRNSYIVIAPSVCCLLPVACCWSFFAPNSSCRFRPLSPTPRSEITDQSTVCIVVASLVSGLLSDGRKEGEIFYLCLRVSSRLNTA